MVERGKLEELLHPCPFCGAGETLLDEQTYWTGMRSQVLSVTLRHWCAAAADEFVRGSVSIRCRDEQQAVEQWNRRALLAEAGTPT